MTTLHDRALGALLGSFVGDALGAQTEFKREKEVRMEFPEGIHNMNDTSRFVGQAGQVTDDSEMMIMMLQAILDQGYYSQTRVREAYRKWRDSGPLDIGITIFGALDGNYSQQSQANGALMRITPLGILGCRYSLTSLMRLADTDCTITHIHPVCRDSNRLYAFALSLAICKGWDIHEIYSYLMQTAASFIEEPTVLQALAQAKDEPPKGIDGPYKGWVLVALQLAIYTALHFDSFEEGMGDLIMRAGDADTNAAIYGALAGALGTAANIPNRWIEDLRISNCLKSLLEYPHKRLETLADEWVTELLALPVVQ